MPPKTASNSIKEMLRISGVNLTSPKKQTLPHIHLKLSEIKNEYELVNLLNYKIIQVVRNPYDRMASAYYHQLRLLPNSKFKEIGFQKFLELLLECYYHQNFLECFYEDLTFIDNSISSKMHWGGSRLFNLQSSWNDLNHDLFYFKLEDLRVNINPLSDFMGIKLTHLPKINDNSITDYSTLLSPKNKELIEKIFVKDFETYSY
jgi:hypothetical protein